MLAVPADRLPAAIGDLDPGNRALLDLSLRRGVSDAEIGELLRKEPAEVARGRDAVLELLADALDVGGHDRRDRVRVAVAVLPDDAWQPRRPPTPPSATTQLDDGPEPDAKPSSPAAAARARPGARGVPRASWTTSTGSTPTSRRRSRRGGLLAVLGLLAVVVALIAVLSSGGDDDESEGGNGNGSQPAQNGGPAAGGHHRGAGRGGRRQGLAAPCRSPTRGPRSRSAACPTRRAASTASGCTTAS